MKKAIILAIILTITSYFPARSEGSLEMSFKLGLSTPNDQVNNIYNSGTLEGQDVLGRLWREGTKLGYHLGIGLRLPLDENFKFVGGIAWHRFPETKIEIKDQTSQNLLATLQTTQNVFPINAGVNFYPLITDFINIYGTGELTYNFISSTVDYVKNDITFPLNIDTAPMDNRVGFGLGVGFDIDIKLLILNLEAKYNFMNLIGKESGEPDKTYFTLSLGVVF